MERKESQQILKTLLKKLKSLEDDEYRNILLDIPFFYKLNIFFNIVENNTDTINVALKEYRCSKNQYKLKIEYDEFYKLNVDVSTDYISIYLEFEDYTDDYKHEEYYRFYYNKNTNDYKNNMDILFENGGLYSKLYLKEVLEKI